jgi:23S rRNA (cytidine1920-2'-O)/16S rRNA (cytidine1409-2'-O)-methyltransferase
MTSSRLDQELVKRGLLASRSRARLAIKEGHVVVDGDTVLRPSQQVGPTADIRIDPVAGRYVGRGARKLSAALGDFPIEVEGRRAVDVGASTGGFTEVLLENGASSVVAIDVGRGQLHDRLRADARVVSIEGLNIRGADIVAIGAPFDVIVADLSFISLQTVATELAALGATGSDWVVLVKPQFEVGAADLGKGGVVRSGGARLRALERVVSGLMAAGLYPHGVTRSPVAGGSGNIEVLLWLRASGPALPAEELYKVLNDE